MAIAMGVILDSNVTLGKPHSYIGLPGAGCLTDTLALKPNESGNCKSKYEGEFGVTIIVSTCEKATNVDKLNRAKRNNLIFFIICFLLFIF
jgi:hypothetical protein